MSSSAYEQELHKMWALSTQEPVDDTRNRLLRFILLQSTHKTYKYILINGLLGAAARWNNPLVLQAQSGLERAWDARSVCHKILVPFEREHMEGRLGSSNEPFLNKPARFPHLDRNNAVRRGSDKQVLIALIDLFQSIADQADAKSLLRNALFYLRQIPPQQLEILTSVGGASLDSLLNEMLRQNVEGEILTFCVGLILWSQFDREKFNIVLHKTNQSGASSKEIADIDVLARLGDLPAACFEVKDKRFSAYDFEHAESKARSQGALSFTFVSRGEYISAFAKDDPAKYIAHKRRIISIEALLKVFSYSSVNLSKDDINEYFSAFIEMVKPKEETLEALKAVWT